MQHLLHHLRISVLTILEIKLDLYETRQRESAILIPNTLNNQQEKKGKNTLNNQQENKLLLTLQRDSIPNARDKQHYKTGKNTLDKQREKELLLTP